MSPSVYDVMGRRLPICAAQAKAMGLVDEVFGDSAQDFISAVHERAQRLAASADLPMLLHTKQQRHDHDEAARPLADDRAQELQHMQRCFYGFDPSYHIASSNFVHRVAPSWTPRHLATHRRQATR